MPDRLIRDEYLVSERYWSVPEPAQLLFHHLMSVADDYGNCSGVHFWIKQKCYTGRHMDNQVLDTLLSALQDVDLIRLYEYGLVRYIHIPRFRQRLRQKHRKWPESPYEKQTLDVKNVSHMPDTGQAHDGHVHVEVKRSEVKRREEKLKLEVLETTDLQHTYRAESSKTGLDPVASPEVISITLNNKSEFAITQSQIDEWDKLFPGVDVLQTLKEIRAWNLANPARRKTKTGVLRHVVAWLSKEQNHG